MTAEVVPLQQEVPVPTVKRKKGSAREQILEAAAKLFGERGVEGASTTEVAKAGGVTQPLIHYHFKSKENLYVACVAYKFQQEAKEYEPLVTAFFAESSVAERKKIVLKLLDLFFERVGYDTFYNRALLDIVSKPERIVALDNVNDGIGVLKKVYQHGVQDGYLRDMSFDEVCSLLSLVFLPTIEGFVDVRNEDSPIETSQQRLIRRTLFVSEA